MGLRETHPEIIVWIRTAASLVRESVRTGPRSMAHKLAFGSGQDGQAHSDEAPGLATIWLSSRVIEGIQADELRKIGKKIGTRPVRE